MKGRHWIGSWKEVSGSIRQFPEQHEEQCKAIIVLVSEGLGDFTGQIYKDTIREDRVEKKERYCDILWEIEKKNTTFGRNRRPSEMSWCKCVLVGEKIVFCDGLDLHYTIQKVGLRYLMFLKEVYYAHQGYFFFFFFFYKSKDRTVIKILWIWMKYFYNLNMIIQKSFRNQYADLVLKKLMSY